MSNDLRNLIPDPEKHSEFKEDLDTIRFIKKTTINGFRFGVPVQRHVNAFQDIFVKCTGIHEIKQTETIILQCDTYNGSEYDATYFIPLLDKSEMELECHLV